VRLTAFQGKVITLALTGRAHPVSTGSFNIGILDHFLERPDEDLLGIQSAFDQAISVFYYPDRSELTPQI
jgi:hypothetical protein